MQFKINDKRLTIYLAGRIDSNNVAEVEKNVQNIIKQNPDCELIFDADNLIYISSAGLRFLLKFRKSHGKISVENVSKEVYDIFEMTGFTQLFDVQKKLRNVSVEGCELIGTGLSSKVYRIDADTVIKVYDIHVPYYKITREIDLAKKAFLAGIPTAISYDIVRCGENYGVVFELIANAMNVGNSLTANGGADFDTIMKKFAAMLKLMHNTEVDDAAGFPSIKGTWLDWAEGMKKFYTADEFNLLEKMILTVPDRKTIVHCDFHSGNTMYQDGEIVVIDMADVGYAHPIFDFAAGAFHALVSNRSDVQRALSLSTKNILHYWDSLLENYFETTDERRLNELKEIFKAFAYLRCALFPMKHVQISDDLKKFYVANARRDLFPQIDWAMRQAEKLNALNL
ncbi:MAG: anti-sigma factor antagonist [Selenomonadaceae bacterium]|nr:anti-sigma factor antagonist [Selenomonadaceae bacterium]